MSLSNEVMAGAMSFFDERLIDSYSVKFTLAIDRGRVRILILGEPDAVAQVGSYITEAMPQLTLSIKADRGLVYEGPLYTWVS